MAVTRGVKAVEAVDAIAGRLSGVAAAALARQRVLVTQGLVLVALAFAFATSTSVFNATYNAQSQVDAALTNGADVSVTAPTAWAGADKLAALGAVPGGVAVQPMHHRVTYVGTDLQDLFGIDQTHIGEATTLANAYFVGNDARGTLSTGRRGWSGHAVCAGGRACRRPPAAHRGAA